MIQTFKRTVVICVAAVMGFLVGYFNDIFNKPLSPILMKVRPDIKEHHPRNNKIMGIITSKGEESLEKRMYLTKMDHHPKDKLRRSDVPNGDEESESYSEDPHSQSEGSYSKHDESFKKKHFLTNKYNRNGYLNIGGPTREELLQKMLYTRSYVASNDDYSEDYSED